jgi:hypothetical protein
MQTITAIYLHPLSEGELYPHLIVRQSNHQSNFYHKSPVSHPFISIKRPFILRTPWAGIYFALDGSSPILPGKLQTAQLTK